MIRIPTICASGALAVAALTLAACGSTTGASIAPLNQSAAASHGSTTSSQPPVVIGTFKTPQDGTLITGANQRTLYVFQPDERATAGHNKLSTCYGGCASVWPPVLAPQLPAVSGQANATLVGMTTRKDGTKQVTYGGLPLYYYAADTKAGQATGNHLKDGFGLWTGLLATGKLAPDGSS